MTDTAEAILDVAQELIQTQGFSATSFQDIAERVGIRKPSIIHHFPSKNALGRSVILRYRLYFEAALEEVKQDPAKTAWDALEFYFTPYRQFGDTPDKVCLCGALAGEVMSLSPEMRAELKRFFEGHQAWLEDILRQGLSDGSFSFKETPRRLSRFLVAALQGALLVERATGNRSQLDDVIESVRNALRRG